MGLQTLQRSLGINIIKIYNNREQHMLFKQSVLESRQLRGIKLYQKQISPT